MSDTPQKRIFDKLREMMPADVSLADQLTEWLHVSSDSSYRRIRGETPLTVNELVTLCERTAMTPNQLLNLGAENQVMFEPNFAKASVQSFKSYLQNIVGQLTTLHSYKETKVIYCSKDLPIFHFFLHPELAAFKYHFWMHVVMQDPAYQDRPFEFQVTDKEIIQLQESALDLYNAIPSIEIWNSESANSTLFQIDFYKHSRHFDSAKQLGRLYDALDEIVYHIEKQAEAGTKFWPGQNPGLHQQNYEMYYNQVALSDNTMLAVTNQMKVAVLNYGVLNYLTCYDQAFCASVEVDLNNLIRRATKLSEENVRKRVMFFNAIHEKINFYRKML